MLNAMPKLVAIDMRVVNQHEKLLGPDTNESSRLCKNDWNRKLRLCEKIVSALQGKGLIE